MRDALLQARSLLVSCTAAGVHLEVVEGNGIALHGEPNEALEARIGAMCGEGEHRHGLPTNRALRALLRARTDAARDFLCIPVVVASQVPEPFTATFRRRERLAIITTFRQDYETAPQRGLLPFLAKEVVAAAQAVELGRATGRELDQWLDAKSRGRWVLTPEIALDLFRGAQSPTPPALLFGELFDALSAELVSVDVHERPGGP